MSREEIIQKTSKNYYDLLQFLKDNPDVLERWKLGTRARQQAQPHQPTTAAATSGISQNDYREYSR